MNIEDIKIGETYNVRMKFANIDEDGNYCFNMETKPYLYRLFNKTDVETCVFPMPDPANDIKNTENASKYDPCRLFRRGDKVRVVEERNDRIPPICGRIEPGKVYTVSGNEDGGDVMLEVEGKYDCISWLWLDLVTPVEELEPYSVVNAHTHWDVTDNDMKTVVTYSKAYHPHAKAAAEAECARLNAEHRKEQNNG